MQDVAIPSLKISYCHRFTRGNLTSTSVSKEVPTITINDQLAHFMCFGESCLQRLKGNDERVQLPCLDSGTRKEAHTLSCLCSGQYSRDLEMSNLHCFPSIGGLQVSPREKQKNLVSSFSALHEPIVCGYLLIFGSKLKWIIRDLSKIRIRIEPDMLHGLVALLIQGKLMNSVPQLPHL